jgi:hypothetical protein
MADPGANGGKPAALQEEPMAVPVHEPARHRHSLTVGHLDHPAASSSDPAKTSG